MQRSKATLQTCLLSVLAFSGNVYSGSVNERIDSLHNRLHKMETTQLESNVQIHGAVEVEYGYSEDYSGVDSSDIVLATVELVVEAKLNDNVDVQLSLLHEEDDTPVEVDVGIINLHNDTWPVSVSVGQMYVPFGTYNSNMVSDPLTLELGELRESAILVNYKSNVMTANFYVFNGDIEEGFDEDKANKFGLGFVFENDAFTAGLDYISAFSDTDTLQDNLASGIVKQVAGLSAHGAYTIDNMSVIFEYVGAMDNYDAVEIVFNGQGAQPSAMNLELSMSIEDSTIAISYQTTDEALALGQPESRAIVSYSTELYASTVLAFEYLSDSDYGITDGGTDKSANTFTAQLAVEF